MTPIERFSAYIINKPLYNYQAKVANAIIHSINHNLGQIITVMMARQSGKNQLSAIIEAFLLFAHREGTITKAAPTFILSLTPRYDKTVQKATGSALTPNRIWLPRSLSG